MPIVKPLAGHTTPETAYRVEGYPYGFRLKCSIRYWLERDPKRGYRFCSQTTNPKKSVEVWNAPKKSTYSAFGVMGLDEQGHVTWTGCGAWDRMALERLSVEFPSLEGDQAKDLDAFIKVNRAMEARRAKAKEMGLK